MQSHETTAESSGLGIASDLPAGNGQAVAGAGTQTPPAKHPAASVNPLETLGANAAVPSRVAPPIDPSTGLVWESISAGTTAPNFDLRMAAEEAERTTGVELTPTADLNRASSEALLLRRIRDYETKSLKASNPLKAVLGALNAGLMRLSGPLQATLESYLKAAPLTPERLERVAPFFDFHLRLAHQIQRFAQPEISPRRGAAKTPPAAPPTTRRLPR